MAGFARLEMFRMRTVRTWIPRVLIGVLMSVIVGGRNADADLGFFRIVQYGAFVAEKDRYDSMVLPMDWGPIPAFVERVALWNLRDHEIASVDIIKSVRAQSVDEVVRDAFRKTPTREALGQADRRDFSYLAAFHLIKEAGARLGEFTYKSQGQEFVIKRDARPLGVLRMTGSGATWGFVVDLRLVGNDRVQIQKIFSGLGKKVHWGPE